MKKKYDRIEIACIDKDLFTKIAQVVDKKGFLQEIKKAREELGISTIPYNIPTSGNNKDLEMDEALKTYNDKYIDTEEFILMTKNLVTARIGEETILGKIIKKVIEIRKKFNLSSKFDSIVFKSIVSNCVTEFDLSKVPSIHVNEFTGDFESDYFEKNDVLLTISANTTQSEVIEAFKRAYSKYFGTPDSSKPSDIHKLRERYWKHLSSKNTSNKNLAEEEGIGGDNPGQTFWYSVKEYKKKIGC